MVELADGRLPRTREGLEVFPFTTDLPPTAFDRSWASKDLGDEEELAEAELGVVKRREVAEAGARGPALLERASDVGISTVV